MSAKITPVEEAVRWYESNLALYEGLHSTVRNILEEHLKNKKLPYHEVTSRRKDVDSFRLKYIQKQYTKCADCTDLAGIRITVYLLSQIQAIDSLVRTCFEINPDLSLNQSELLGEDRVGYQSIHYIAKFPSGATDFQPYAHYKDAWFEIQLRTILQHAWSEIEHDRSYKFSGTLPIHLRRRFKLMAGHLEIADNELDTIALEIDNYSQMVVRQSQTGQLDIEINSTSLKIYIDIRFSSIPNYRPIDEPIPQEYINKLLRFQIHTIQDFNDLLTSTILRELRQLSTYNTIFLLFIVLVCTNPDIYFDEPTKFFINMQHAEVLKRLGVDLSVYNNVEVF